ncbi:hypothetical protein AMTRI_Chr04g253620 [Amborella trichopoda]
MEAAAAALWLRFSSSSSSSSLAATTTIYYMAPSPYMAKKKRMMMMMSNNDYHSSFPLKSRNKFPITFSSSPRRRRRRRKLAWCVFAEKREEEEKEEEEMLGVEEALHMEGGIPLTSDQFVKQVSSRAYDMRRQLNQCIDSSSYDVLEVNPWREDSKPVYVLTQQENQLLTMKTRRNRSEVERELGMLFSKEGKRRSENGTHGSCSTGSTRFHMLVEDVREGVLVFEDEQDATRYCNLLEGGGQGCDGVAELEASSVFDLCHKMRALAVLFRRGRTPPLPKSLELNLRARKRSLEDREELN